MSGGSATTGRRGSSASGISSPAGSSGPWSTTRRKRGGRRPSGCSTRASRWRERTRRPSWAAAGSSAKSSTSNTIGARAAARSHRSTNRSVARASEPADRSVASRPSRPPPSEASSPRSAPSPSAIRRRTLRRSAAPSRADNASVAIPSPRATAAISRNRRVAPLPDGPDTTSTVSSVGERRGPGVPSAGVGVTSVSIAWHAARKRASGSARPTRPPPTAAATASSGSRSSCARTHPASARSASRALPSAGRRSGSRSSSAATIRSRLAGASARTRRSSGAATRRRRPRTSPAPPVPCGSVPVSSRHATRPSE